ncbi:chaperonin 10-like protein [Suillus occidentalis]|nr:chaperonin 10-like protein [Suillus occidentalis]
MCGSDGYIHEGELLIPGHETIGKVVEMGKDVEGFEIGDRCVADCDDCFYCRRGNSVLCENFKAKGIALDGGFAEYVVYHQKKPYKIKNLTDEESTLLEPAACAIHGLDKLNPPSESMPSSSAQNLQASSSHSSSSSMVPPVSLSPQTKASRWTSHASSKQWQKLKDDNPYGFDVVIEATGVEKIADMSIRYVRRGGTLMIYGVYENKALVHWSPSKIFGDEITTYCFPRAVAYLDSGKVKVKGMVTDVFMLEDYQLAIDKIRSRRALKIVIKP